MPTKYKAKDIAEIIASDKGYINKIEENFNQSEWYGFTNRNNDILRIKHIVGCNQKFNIHRSKEPLEEIAQLLVIIHLHDTYRVFKIKNFEKTPIVITLEQLNNEEKLITDAIEEIGNMYISNDELYKITQVNNTIAGIYQRTDDKVNEDAIKQLLCNEEKCSYCGITQKQIDNLNSIEIKHQKKLNENPYGLTIRARGKKMEVDQIKPKAGYVKGNITLSCYWCNNAKTDTFSIQEFKSIARGINIAWNHKMKDAGIKETICFPENSDIWDNTF